MIDAAKAADKNFLADRLTELQQDERGNTYESKIESLRAALLQATALGNT